METEQDKVKREAARKRTLTYCNKCGGTCTNEMPHPLGPPLVVLQCGACGNERVLVKKSDGYYKKPGGK